ncbi:MAG: DUF308 domain-containing protein [Pseudomonadota bacterium]
MASEMTNGPAPGAAGETVDRFRQGWKWLLGIGIAMVLGGFLTFLMPVAASVAATLMAGIAMLAGGMLQAAHAWQCEGWKGRLFYAACAALYLIGAFVLLVKPLAGLVALTLLAIAFIIANGVTRLIVAFQMRPAEGWDWLALAGGLSVGLGVLLYGLFPGVSLWLLGLLLGISFVTEGAAYIAVALAAKRALEA